MIRFHPDAEEELHRLDVLTQTRLLAALKRIEEDPELVGSLGLASSPTRWARIGNCLVRFRRIDGTVLSREPFILVTAIQLRESREPG